MTITTVFDPPLPTDSAATFNAKAFDTVSKLNAWTDEANSTADDVNDDAAAAAASQAAALASQAAAAASAAAADASATAAASSAGAAIWVSGTYAEGAAARSPSTLRVYINRTTGSRTTDPALDPTNWAFPAGYLTLVARTGTSHTVTANERSVCTNAGAVALTLPTTLAVGDEWAGHFDNARFDNSIDVGSNSITHNGVTRSGVITLNQRGSVHLIWCGDFWRFK